MHVLKSTLFARASLGAIAIAAVAAATPAGAQPVVISGGGATLPSSLLADLFACYNGVDNPAFPTNCAANIVNPSSAVTFEYDSVGSGAGLRGFASQDARRFRNPAVVGEVDFAASESPLSSGQYNSYNNGGRFSAAPNLVDLADTADNCVVVPGAADSPPANSIGNNSADPNSPSSPPPGAPCYDSPRAEAGPIIQIPFAGTAVAVAFDPVYKQRRLTRGVQRFRYQYDARPSGGGLNLSRDALCGIFSGRIQFWDDPIITAANNNVPVYPDPADTTAVSNPLGREIRVVVRDDDSGTTNLFVRHLISVCGPTDSGFTGQPIGQRFPGSTAVPIPAGNFGACPVRTNTVFPALNTGTSGGRFQQARGNEGVTTCLNTRNPGPNVGDEVGNGRVGYLSPDFVQPYVAQNPYRGFGIVSADVANAAGNYIEPTPTSTAVAIANFPAPTGADRADARNWVVGNVQYDPSLNNVFNDPAGAQAYPIVGTTNFLLYTCYETRTVTDPSTGATTVLDEERNALVGPATGTAPSGVPNGFGFLNFLYATTGAFAPSGNARPDVRTIINGSGFAVVPRDFREAVIRTFITNTSGLNLQIRSAPAAGFNASSPQPTVGCSVGG